MTRLTTIASGAMGLVSGAVGMAIPMALEMTPFKSLATGATVALGVGITTYGLWHKHGQSYLAGHITKVVDAAFKEQKETLQQYVADSVKRELPAMIATSTLVDDAIRSVVDTSLDSYATDPQTVYKVLDDIDRRIPYENNVILKEFVNQATNSILEAKCTGYYAPLQSILRKPLNRIVATVAANYLRKATETAVAKAKETFVGNTLNTLEAYAQADLASTLNWGLGLL